MQRTGAPQRSASQSFQRAAHFSILNPLSAREWIKTLKTAPKQIIKTPSNHGDSVRWLPVRHCVTTSHRPSAHVFSVPSKKDSACLLLQPPLSPRSLHSFTPLRTRSGLPTAFFFMVGFFQHYQHQISFNIRAWETKVVHVAAMGIWLLPAWAVTVNAAISALVHTF